MKTLEDVIIKEIEGIIKDGWDVHQEVFDIMTFFDGTTAIVMIKLDKEWFTLSVLIPSGIHNFRGDENWWKTEEEAMDLARSLAASGYEDYSDTARLILSAYKL